MHVGPKNPQVRGQSAASAAQPAAIAVPGAMNNLKRRAIFDALVEVLKKGLKQTAYNYSDPAIYCKNLPEALRQKNPSRTPSQRPLFSLDSETFLYVVPSILEKSTHQRHFSDELKNIALTLVEMAHCVNPNPTANLGEQTVSVLSASVVNVAMIKAFAITLECLLPDRNAKGSRDFQFVHPLGGINRPLKRLRTNGQAKQGYYFATPLRKCIHFLKAQYARPDDILREHAARERSSATRPSAQPRVQPSAVARADIPKVNLPEIKAASLSDDECRQVLNKIANGLKDYLARENAVSRKQQNGLYNKLSFSFLGDLKAKLRNRKVKLSAERIKVVQVLTDMGLALKPTVSAKSENIRVDTVVDFEQVLNKLVSTRTRDSSSAASRAIVYQCTDVCSERLRLSGLLGGAGKSTFATQEVRPVIEVMQSVIKSARARHEEALRERQQVLADQADQLRAQQAQQQAVRLDATAVLAQIERRGQQAIQSMQRNFAEIDPDIPGVVSRSLLAEARTPVTTSGAAGGFVVRNLDVGAGEGAGRESSSGAAVSMQTSYRGMPAHALLSRRSPGASSPRSAAADAVAVVDGTGVSSADAAESMPAQPGFQVAVPDVHIVAAADTTFSPYAGAEYFDSLLSFALKGLLRTFIAQTREKQSTEVVGEQLRSVLLGAMEKHVDAILPGILSELLDGKIPDAAPQTRAAYLALLAPKVEVASPAEVGASAGDTASAEIGAGSGESDGEAPADDDSGDDTDAPTRPGSP